MKSTEDEDHKVPYDPLTADKAAWKRHWDDALREEQQSDEHTRQLIEEGRHDRKQRFLEFVRQWKSRLLETPEVLQPQELRDAIIRLSAEAGKIRGDTPEKDFDRLCDAVRHACVEAGDTDGRALDRHNIVNAIAALVDFVERI
jgi:hypothetical protein